jgi:hypothetical protein
MRLIRTLILSAVFATAIEAIACGGVEGPQLHEHVRYYPIVDNKTSHWPAEIKVTIGSVASFLVPANAKVAIEDGKGGDYPAIAQLDDKGDRYVRTSPNMVPAWVDIEHDAKKYKWVHFIASSYGLADVRMQAPGGWSRTVKFSSIYPSQADSPSRPPVKINLNSDGERKVALDGYDTLEVTVAGHVADGWTASPASETGLVLIRVQQVETTYSRKPGAKASEQEGKTEQIPGVTSSVGKHELIESSPQVKLFFGSTSGPKTSTMVLHRGSGFSGKTFEFKIEARPTPKC